MSTRLIPEQRILRRRVGGHAATAKDGGGAAKTATAPAANPSSDTARDYKADPDRLPPPEPSPPAAGTDDGIVEFVARTTKASGVPLFVEDLAVIDDIAKLVAA